MKATELPLDRFFSQNRTQFVIPVYQRNYDWSKKECEKLLQDILEAGRDRTLHSHFIGSIVFVHDQYSSAGPQQLVIIDGQQRLTTFTLIYLAIHHLAKELGNEELQEEIMNTYLINRYSKGEARLKLRPTDNNQRALDLLIQGEHELFEGFSRLIENFKFIKSWINADNYEAVLDGVRKIFFVEISLDRNHDNPQRIFESLNSTGLALSQADLIRNYILMGLSIADQGRLYRDYWEPIEQYARLEATKEGRVSEFIRAYLTMVRIEIPRKSGVYEEFKKEFPNTDLESLTPKLEHLRKSARYYQWFLNPEKAPSSALTTQLRYLKVLEVNVAYPFMLKVFEDFEDSLLSEEELINVLETIQSFVWRRFIAGVPTNALNKIFMNLIKKIDSDDYSSSIEMGLFSRRGNQRWPDDDEIREVLASRDLYNISGSNKKYLFERLENHSNREFVPVMDNDQITVEHIFPQKPHSDWKEDLPEKEFKDFSEKYLHTLPNLTLSGNNGALGNLSFSRKKEMNSDGKEQGYEFSRLWLNRYLQSIDQWNEEHWQARLELLRERVLAIWKRPSDNEWIMKLFDFSSDSEDEVSIFEADDPTHRNLEYAVFQGQTLNVSSIAEMYRTVAALLLEQYPQAILESGLRRTLGIAQEKSALRYGQDLTPGYFIEMNLDSKNKFRKLRTVLEALDLQDALLLKYSD